MASHEFEKFMELMTGDLACPEDSLEAARKKPPTGPNPPQPLLYLT